MHSRGRPILWSLQHCQMPLLVIMGRLCRKAMEVVLAVCVKPSSPQTSGSTAIICTSEHQVYHFCRFTSLHMCSRQAPRVNLSSVPAACAGRIDMKLLLVLQITVDGDTSTNDTCIGLASGAAGNDLIKHSTSEAAQKLEAAVTALLQVCLQGIGMYSKAHAHATTLFLRASCLQSSAWPLQSLCTDCRICKNVISPIIGLGMQGYLHVLCPILKWPSCMNQGITYLLNMCQCMSSTVTGIHFVLFTMCFSSSMAH